MASSWGISMFRVRMADLPLAVKVGVAPGLALAMLATVGVTGFINEQQSTSALDRVVKVQMPERARMGDISRELVAAHGEMYRLLTQQGAKIDTAQIDGRMKALSARFDTLSKELAQARDVAPANERPMYNRVLKQLGDVHSAVDLIGAMIGSDFATAAGFAAPFEDSYQQMTRTLDQLVSIDTRAIYAAAEANAARAQESMRLSAMLAALTLLAVGAVAAFFTLATRRDIKKIAGVTERLAAGDTSLDLAALTRRDELGAMVQSLTVFRDNQLNLEQLRVSQEEAAAAAEVARRAKLEEDERAAAETRAVVQALAEGLSKLADGDLTFRIEAGFPEAAQKLKADFNTTMEQLQDAVSVIVDNASRMRSGAGEISGAADDLSRRTEQQAATLEETAAALDQITATVKKTADGATQCRQTVSVTKTDAEKSGAVVREAVGAMGQIEKSASEISQIIGVIDEIAFQTNLLALNAGVEAARAGDAGRGFAVVASEVRALAQRSAQAAKEIKALISASTQQVRTGVNLVGQTGEALSRIVAQVGEINALVLDMAASAEEQAGGLQQVNTAVNQMDQVTQQNAAMVEESTAASHALAAEAATLTELVSRFRIGATAVQAVLPAAPRQAPPRAAPAARPAAIRRSSAQAKPAAVEDGWEEF
jgi:methyl-accepting chemotaxis protein